MTKRKDPADLKIRARDDLTPKPRLKSKAKMSPEGQIERIAKLRQNSPNNSTNAGVALANPDRPLTEKQKAFVRFWAQGETILSASYKAGYADGGAVAYRLCKDPAILKIYNREKALYEESCQMSRKKVMEGLLEGVEMAKLMGEPASMISGWREIGKMCGYYEPVKRQIDINVKGNVTVQRLERMSDADLLRVMRGEIEDVAFEEVLEEGGDGEDE